MPKGQNKVRHFFLHALLLAAVIFLVRLWTSLPILISYSLPLAIFLAFLYFASRYIFKKTLIVETTILIAILLLLLAVTGELNSPLFFLVYFLLFASALLFEPPITLTLTLALALFFGQSLNSLHGALQLFSLLLFTPLAIYFGRQYLKLLEAKKQIKILGRQKNQLAKSLEEEEGDSLLWLSLNFKNTLLGIIHQTSEILADNRLPLGKTSRDSLQSVHDRAKKLLRSGQKLMEKIDLETD
jgi:hypothetical protein